MSKDRRRKEWITYSEQNNKQLGKIVKKKKKKILVEHWLMQNRDNKLSTEISRCDGCINKDLEAEDGCLQ